MERVVEEVQKAGIIMVDTEPIVRCEDCKHGRSPQQGLPWMCIRNCCAHFPIDPDGFCKWGERRADHD